MAHDVVATRQDLDIECLGFRVASIHFPTMEMTLIQAHSACLAGSLSFGSPVDALHSVGSSLVLSASCCISFMASRHLLCRAQNLRQAEAQLRAAQPSRPRSAYNLFSQELTKCVLPPVSPHLSVPCYGECSLQRNHDAHLYCPVGLQTPIVDGVRMYELWNPGV